MSLSTVEHPLRAATQFIMGVEEATELGLVTLTTLMKVPQRATLLINFLRSIEQEAGN